MKIRVLFFVAALLSLVSASAQIGVGTTSPNSTLDVRGALSLNFRTFSGTSTSISSTDNTVVFMGTAASTATLPDATTCIGRMYRIKNASSNTSLLTIATTSAQTIDGASSWSLDEQNETITVVSDGTNWYVSSQSLPNALGTWSQGGNSVTAARNFGTTSNYDLPMVTNNTERMRITNGGNVGIGTSTFSGTNPERLIVDAGTDGSGNYQNVIVGKGNTNSYAQLNIQNGSAGTASSSDVVATANNGNESVNYIDMGINGGGNTSTGIYGGANTAYLYSTGNDFALGNATANKNLLFFTGGTASANERMRINGSGNVGIGNTSPNSTLSITGSIAVSYFSTNGNYTLTATDYVVVSTAATGKTFTLPTASTCTGRVYKIVNHSGGSLTLSASVTIANGSTTTTLANTAGSNTMEIISDGTIWRQIN